MKKLLFVCIAALLLSACEVIPVEEYEEYTENEPAASILTPSNSVSYEVTSKKAAYVVDASTENLTLSGSVKGKKIYYAVVNTTSKSVSKDLVRYANGTSARSAAVQSEEIEEAEVFYDDEITTVQEYDFEPEFDKSSSEKARIIANIAVPELKYEEGVTKKNIFMADSNNGYTLKSATLWAYNDICNVWIADDDKYIQNENRRKYASDYARKFESIYPMIRNVFGQESNEIYTSTSGQKTHMNYVNNTGTKVNIVLYDLYGCNNGVVGFFSSIDYYKNHLAFSNVTIDHSNEGKFFYIDSWFCKTRYDLTVSTLAHEFQHMIHFGVKTMKGIKTDTNFNEMMSMLCEDMLQSHLSIKDSDSPKHRLPHFIRGYYSYGIRAFNNTAQAYANAYAFGAWLTRNFGGTALIKEMMSNGKANNSCIVSAVNALNGTSYTFNTLFAEFVTSCFAKKELPVFANQKINDVPSSYGMLLKEFGRVNSESVTISFNSDSGLTNSGLLIYVYVE
ncbi:hypothetical protein [Treponema sp.]|uniref:hypothetical protein n=1 Tax=Treponema sp. TaxID=166 RepID=UPI0038907D66